MFSKFRPLNKCTKTGHSINECPVLTKNFYIKKSLKDKAVPEYFYHPGPEALYQYPLSITELPDL